jgi:hypothetical protein
MLSVEVLECKQRANGETWECHRRFGFRPDFRSKTLESCKSSLQALWLCCAYLTYKKCAWPESLKKKIFIIFADRQKGRLCLGGDVPNEHPPLYTLWMVTTCLCVYFPAEGPIYITRIRHA